MFKTVIKNNVFPRNIPNPKNAHFIDHKFCFQPKNQFFSWIFGISWKSLFPRSNKTARDIYSCPVVIFSGLIFLNADYVIVTKPLFENFWLHGHHLPTFTSLSHHVFAHFYAYGYASYELGVCVWLSVHVYEKEMSVSLYEGCSLCDLMFGSPPIIYVPRLSSPVGTEGRRHCIPVTYLSCNK